MTLQQSPFKSPLDRALNWVLSSNGFGRIPLYTSSDKLLLIKNGKTSYYIQFKARNSKYVVSWADASGRDKEKEISKPDLIQWLQTTEGKSPPVEDSQKDFLTVTELSKIYNASVSKIRADLSSLTTEQRDKFTKTGRGGCWLVQREFIEAYYKDHPKRENVDLDAFQPKSEEYLPMRELSLKLNIPFETVRSYFRRKKSTLTERRFIRRNKGKIEFHVELAEALWGEI